MTNQADDDEHVPAPEGLAIHRIDSDLALISYPHRQPVVPQALTPHEEALALSVYSGASNEQIGRDLNISAKRVGRALEHLYRKLGVSSRAQLVLRMRGREGG